MFLRALERWSRADWHKNIFVKGLYLSYALFLLAFTGIMKVDPTYLSTLEAGLRYYVCFFLIVRFNPLSRKRAANTKASIEFDRRVAYSAGIFLLLTTALTQTASAHIRDLYDQSIA
tara:strand:- start:5229 stop:5579 length:351 start_codon:yes stop_codon:yes gene_type:complete